jgi:protein required for attachment to host cells
MHEARKLYFVIADAGRARLVRRRSEDGSYVTVQTLEPSDPDLPARLDRGEQAGRVVESSGVRRHKIELRVDPHARAELAFAKEIFQRLDDLLKAKEIEAFVLVAPTRMLNALQEEMAPALAGAVAGRLAKDLTKVPDHDLLDHLNSVDLRMALRPSGARSSLSAPDSRQDGSG